MPSFKPRRVCTAGAPRQHTSRGRMASICRKRNGEQVSISSRSRSEEHTSELQSRLHLVCRLLLEKKKKIKIGVYMFEVEKTLLVPALSFSQLLVSFVIVW